MKTIWIDSETTGLDPIQNDIWQLAYILIDTGREVCRNILECKPYAPWNTDPAALAIGKSITGKSIADIAAEGYRGFVQPWEALEQFTRDLSKMIDKYDKNDKAAIGGYNVVFDLNFISWWAKKSLDRYGIGSFTDYTMLDAAPMVRQMRHLGYLPLENTKLHTVCKYYNIALDMAHNALSDVESAMLVYPCVLKDYRDMLSQDQYYGQLTAGELS